ncbi:hypothetical protein WJ970_14690 [Achromobacter xylosoxidans]
MTERCRARMVPELLVSDLSRSLAFWMDLCGFEIVYRREDEGFVYLDLEGAQFMLEEVRGDDNWITAPLEGPRGTVASTSRSRCERSNRCWSAWPPQAGLCIGNSRSAGTAAMRLKSACASSWSRIRTAICCDSRSGSANGQTHR